LAALCAAALSAAALSAAALDPAALSGATLDPAFPILDCRSEESLQTLQRKIFQNQTLHAGALTPYLCPDSIN
jgi:hypothetical protein